MFILTMFTVLCTLLFCFPSGSYLHPRFCPWPQQFLSFFFSFFLFFLFVIMILSGVWEDIGFLLNLLLSSVYLCYMCFLYVLFNVPNCLDFFLHYNIELCLKFTYYFFHFLVYLDFFGLFFQITSYSCFISAAKF